MAACGFRAPAHPVLVGSAGMAWGYLRSWLKGLPRYDNPEFRRFLRSYQHACLRVGKRAATARLDKKQASIWHARNPAQGSEAERAPEKTVELLGVPIAPVTMENAVAQCLEFCRAPRATHTVVTLNASHLCMIRRDAELEAACRAGDLIVADGMSVVLALRASGQPAPERVAGVDLMAHLMAAAARHNLSVYFLGARREVVNALAARSRVDYPGLKIAGFRDGYFGPQDHWAIVEEIRASKADMLFVGMPSPFKETWVERHRERLQVPIVMGVGGSFDVLAGFVPRAPRWMQSMAMEWSWRLLMEPRKLWKRYLTTNSEFIWLAGREIAARRLGLPLAANSQAILQQPRDKPYRRPEPKQAWLVSNPEVVSTPDPLEALSAPAANGSGLPVGCTCRMLKNDAVHGLSLSLSKGEPAEPRQAHGSTSSP